jgi:hypothetical protein
LQTSGSDSNFLGGAMTNKLIDGKRRSHAAKVLQKLSKEASQPHPQPENETLRNESERTGASNNDTSERPDVLIKEQLTLIRDDVLKLREDLSRGYDMAKNLISKKGIIKDLLLRTR